MSDYDSPWKEALDFYFQAFVELFFPRAYADIDWGRGWESLDKELQQIDPEAEIGRRHVDKLLKVWLNSGQEQWVLVHVEVQVSEEGKFTWRMYVYNYRIFDKYSGNRLHVTKRRNVCLSLTCLKKPVWNGDSPRASRQSWK